MKSQDVRYLKCFIAISLGVAIPRFEVDILGASKEISRPFQHKLLISLNVNLKKCDLL